MGKLPLAAGFSKLCHAFPDNGLRLTFRSHGGLIHMRRRSAFVCCTAAVLLLTLSASASACVIGQGSPVSRPCHRIAHDVGPRKKAAGASQCRPCRVFKSAARTCNIRGLQQLQYVEFAPPRVFAPLLVADSVPAPSRSAVAISCLAFPETDRGPPRS